MKLQEGTPRSATSGTPRQAWKKTREIHEAQLFSRLDENGDGVVTRRDLGDFLYKHGLSSDIAALFDEADEDDDGKLTISDIVHWIQTEAPPVVRRKLLPTEEAVAVANSAVTCAEWFANAIAEAGVTHVYGGHGGALVPMVNAVVCHPKLEWIPTRNEANASLMAAAHAKLTGSLAVCIATSGPGATNLTTGLLEADLDQLPLLALTGLKPREGLGYSEFQDVDQSRLFAGGGISHSVNVASPAGFVPILRDAVAKAVTGYTCVHIAVPVDVQAAKCPVPLMPLTAADAIAKMRMSMVDTSAIEEVAHDLHEATRLGGGRVLTAIGKRCIGFAPEIMKLAERLCSPILTRLDAKGCCDESHPLVWGIIGVHGKPGLESSAKLVQTADLVLTFGVHDCTTLLCNLAGMQVRQMIHFEPDAICVAFNSKYQAVHTVIGNPSKAVDAILEKLDELESCEHHLGTTGQRLTTRAISAMRESGVDTTPPWHLMAIRADARHEDHRTRQGKVKDPPRKCVSEKDLDPWVVVQAQKGNWARMADGRYHVVESEERKHCHPAKVFKEMSKRLDPLDVLCVDTGDVTLWASLTASLTQGQRTLSSEKLGTMGYALCAGLAACLERGEDGRAIVVAGDGGIQMTMNELGTVRQVFANSKVLYRMIIIVFDNEVLGRVAFGFKGALGCSLGPSPDFVALAKAYGGDGARLERPDQLQEVMDRAFAYTGLFLIHALVDPTIKADMANFQDNSIKMMASG
mmetsp:Transcript_67957/g.189829  ORF Transcript_67957/g.189829 Transcript_67957/m.189829 type:complete len:748 (+) Transcript_67957:66-2309(+)|eukprot:CAMPEP_0117515764 /NCGR_PEP_ID=MMETSP0784-20121206/30748_1 /TAXON_ID=39447 /ORGANISM="" /LENGTH=747 /DNA_ID=CAMNT_0005311591 /DNA_START=66 /DNA_END=2309 /DNA_ORIENTATION=-